MTAAEESIHDAVSRGSSSSKRSGFLAGLTLLAAVGFLYLNFEPAPQAPIASTEKSISRRLRVHRPIAPQAGGDDHRSRADRPAKPGEKVTARHRASSTGSPC